jgi:hypothetical protein
VTTMAPSPRSEAGWPRTHDASFHAVQRRLAALIPDGAVVEGGAALELGASYAQDKPRLDPPALIEGKKLRPHRVAGDRVPHFSAFLDGTQSSRVAQYLGGIPIVHGAAAAVVRERRERRMTTWSAPLVRRRLYAPMELLPARVRAALHESGAEVLDTLERRELDSIHPFALQEAALQAVQRDREALERELAEAWVGARAEALLMDGGISDSERVARSAGVVGVVKSHRALHVHGDDLATVLRLEAGERSSVVRVTPRRRTPVASWYLRIRASAGRDPLWGLVRVEIAEPSGSARAVAARADEVSRWVLAEALPLAIPDGRWDKMVYGIRDCEEFLRAIQ